MTVLLRAENHITSSTRAAFSNTIRVFPNLDMEAEKYRFRVSHLIRKRTVYGAA